MVRFPLSVRGFFFSGATDTGDFNIGTPVATFQVSGVLGSALQLVGPMSVYCD